jgi:SAM-dependent methyltransferase
MQRKPLLVFRADAEPGACGDRALDAAGKRRFLFGNLAANIAGAFTPLNLRRFRPTALRSDEAAPSPMRALVDTFLMEELPRRLDPARAISALDIGGGTGYARRLLARAGYTGSYLAVDPVAEETFGARGDAAFASELAKEPFETFRSERRFDLVLSVTSLEHVADDEACAENARRLRAPGGVEIHIVPGGWSLPCYLWHGLRQFSRGRMAAVFGKRGEAVAFFALGGLGTLLLQFFGVTVPERWLRRKLRGGRLYPKLLRAAWALDQICPWPAMVFAAASPVPAVAVAARER